MHDSVIPLPTILHNIEGPSVFTAQVLNIAPGEGQIPVSFTTESNREASAFPKGFPYGRFHFGDTTREMPITLSQYIRACLKCFDNRFPKNPIYIFHTLDWIDRVSISNSINFFERKQFQEDTPTGEIHLRNFRNMLCDDIMKTSFKNIRGTPQYMPNMRSDTMVKKINFNVYTFFSTFAPTEAHWLEFPQIIAREFGINLTDEGVQNMFMRGRHNWLKRNPVTVARHMDHKHKVIFGRTVLMSCMYPIGQILYYDGKRVSAETT